jgi:hypothetical protein
MSQDRRPDDWFTETSSGELDAKIRSAAHREIEASLSVSRRLSLTWIFRWPWLIPTTAAAAASIYWFRRLPNLSEPQIDVSDMDPSSPLPTEFADLRGEILSAEIDDPAALAEFVETLTGPVPAAEERWLTLDERLSSSLNSAMGSSSILEDEELLQVFADDDLQIDDLISEASKET